MAAFANEDRHLPSGEGRVGEVGAMCARSNSPHLMPNWGTGINFPQLAHQQSHLAQVYYINVRGGPISGWADCDRSYRRHDPNGKGKENDGADALIFIHLLIVENRYW